MFQLSKRLQAVADLAGKAGVVADVGTDHGYIPVFLVSSGRADRAIAVDVNEGPLMRARENIRQFHLEGRIEARLSDGLAALRPQEADVIVIAGMGGALMEKILDRGEDVAHMAGRLVLQPQSELFAFRRFLSEHGYRITDEDMVSEDGKYYSMMSAEWMGSQGVREKVTDTALKYGPLLLKGNHPVLLQYLRQQRKQKVKILESLGKNARQNVSERKAQLKLEVEEIEAILEQY